MHTKSSMNAVPRDFLTEHEQKRCRALAKGRRWQVMEEDILWWSLDKQGWFPVQDPMWQERRRWLMIETEEGIEPALLWTVNEAVTIPLRETIGDQSDIQSSADTR